MKMFTSKAINVGNTVFIAFIAVLEEGNIG